MDSAFFRFLRDLSNSLRPQRIMSALSERVIAVLRFLQSGEAALKTELAETKSALAEALGNDAADHAAIEAARADADGAHAIADAAAAKVAELQALADADASEDAAITAALDAITGAQVETDATPSA